ncbi:MAG: IclR family transcriptional regulator domain-containing protein [Gaiellales bacterium]
MARLTGRTLATPAAVRRDLALVRDRGYALERQEAVIGDAGIAAPVFDRRGATVGSIGIAGPVERLMPKGPAVRLTAAVTEAARAVSRELGALRWPPARS